MKKFTVVLMLSLLSATAFAGEDVIVSWTPPSDIATLPYSGYRIYYTDSLGAGSMVEIADPAASQFIVPNVEFGPSTWAMTSLCESCQQTESAPSADITFVVKFKGVPSAPTGVIINLGN